VVSADASIDFTMDRGSSARIVQEDTLTIGGAIGDAVVRLWWTFNYDRCREPAFNWLTFGPWQWDMNFIGRPDTAPYPVMRSAHGYEYPLDEQLYLQIPFGQSFSFSWAMYQGNWSPIPGTGSFPLLGGRSSVEFWMDVLHADGTPAPEASIISSTYGADYMRICNPVPEPSSITMAGIALAILLVSPKPRCWHLAAANSRKGSTAGSKSRRHTDR
jgi:hypothetical protein